MNGLMELSFGKRHNTNFTQTNNLILFMTIYTRKYRLNNETTWGIIEAIPSSQQIQTIIFSTEDNELDISKVYVI
jgi:hypothetical protein